MLNNRKDLRFSKLMHDIEVNPGPMPSFISAFDIASLGDIMRLNDCQDTEQLRQLFLNYNKNGAPFNILEHMITFYWIRRAHKIICDETYEESVLMGFSEGDFESYCSSECSYEHISDAYNFIYDEALALFKNGVVAEEELDKPTNQFMLRDLFRFYNDYAVLHTLNLRIDYYYRRRLLMKNLYQETSDYIANMFKEECLFGIDIDLGDGAKKKLDEYMDSFKDLFTTLTEQLKNFTDIKLLHEFKLPDFGLQKFFVGAFEYFCDMLGVAKEYVFSPKGMMIINFVLCFFIYRYLRKRGFNAFEVGLMIVVIMSSGPPVVQSLLKAVNVTWQTVVTKIGDFFDAFDADDSDGSFVDVDFNDYKEETFFDLREAALKNILTFLFTIIMADSVLKHDYIIQGLIQGGFNFSKYKKSTEVTFEFFADFIADSLKCLGEICNIDFLKKAGIKFPDLQDISDELQEILNELKKGDAYLNHEILDQLDFLRTKVEENIRRCRTDSRYAEYGKQASLLLSTIDNLRHTGGLLNSKKLGPRIEMTSVVFLGQPGTGKSTGVDYLLAGLLPMMMNSVRLRSYIRHRSNEVFSAHSDQGEFWDGYNGQFAVKVDDILQMVDNAGAPNTMVLAIIKMYNTSEYMLNMAFKKGEVVFNSHLLIATDNNLRVNGHLLKSITSPGAFQRRWDFIFLQAPKAEYSTLATRNKTAKDRKLDVQHLHRTRDDGTLDVDYIKNIWEFYDWDWSNGELVGNPAYNFVQVQDKILDRYKTKQLIGQRNLAGIKEVSDAAIEVRLEELRQQEEDDNDVFFDVDNDYEEETIYTINPYKVLKLKENYTKEELVAAYRREALICHPDKGGKNEDMAEVRLAFDILSEPDLLAFWECCQVGKTNDLNLFKDRFNMHLRKLRTKQKVSDEQRIKGFLDLWTKINGKTLGDAYENNTMPSRVFIREYAARFGVDEDFMYGFFSGGDFTEDTPFQDLLLAWRAYINRTITDTIHRTKTILSYIKDQIVDILTSRKFWLSLSVGVAACVGVYKYYLKDKLYPPMREQATYRQKKAVVKAKPKFKAVVLGQAEAKEETARFAGPESDDIKKKISKNLVWFSTEPDGRCHGWLLFYKNKSAVSVSHIMSGIAEDKYEHIYLHRQADKKIMKVNRGNIVMNYHADRSNEDAGYYKFPTISWEFADIIDHFAYSNSREGISFTKPHTGFLLRPIISECIDGIYDITIDKDASFANPVNMQYGSGNWWARKAVVYNIKTGPGHCGRPWMVDRKIAGYHVCGNGSTGVSIIVPREVLEEIYELQTDDTYFKEETLPAQWRVVGEVPFERINTKSQLIKTEMHDTIIDSDKVPALLHPIKRDGVEIDPWFNARDNYGKGGKGFNKVLLNELAERLGQKMISESNIELEEPGRMLTMKEAIEGIPGVLPSLPRGTSAGYPWSKKGRKKYAFFGSDGDYKFDSEAYADLEAKVLSDIKLIEENKKPVWIYQGFLKDEVRRLEKVIDGKTRLVSGSPLCKTVLTSMALNCFRQWLADNRIYNSSLIGVNPYEEWKYIVNFMLEVGDNMFDGDYKNWDGYYPKELSEAVAIVAHMYYFNADEKHHKIIDAVIAAANTSRHLVTEGNKSCICEVDEIMPSGDKLTGDFNTLGNKLLTLYAFADLILRSQGSSADNYTTDVDLDFDLVFKPRSVFLGDDNLHSIPDELKHIIDQTTFAEAVGRVGYTYTSADKKSCLIKHKSILDCTILKRSFVRLKEFPTEWFAALDLEVILTCFYWKEKGAPEGTTQDTIDTSAIELSAHGYDIFKEYAWKLQHKSMTILGHCSPNLPIMNREDKIKECWLKNIKRFMSLNFDYI